jgi:hypothetical protein
VVGIGLGIRASSVQTAGVGAALAVAGLEAIAGVSLLLRPVAEQSERREAKAGLSA